MKTGDWVWLLCDVGEPMECCVDSETGARGVMIGAGGDVAWDVDRHGNADIDTQQGNE